jgi:hypothetical protein
VRFYLQAFILTAIGFASAQAAGPALKLADLPTLDNLVSFVRKENPDASGSRYKSSKSVVEKNIFDSLLEEPKTFLGDVDPVAINFLLQSPDAIGILKRLDALLSSAVQELAEKASSELQKKDAKGQPQALTMIEKIRQLEKKRDELAGLVAAKLNDSNFNAVFDFLVQSHFRRAEGLNHSLVLPKEVKQLLYGRNNPNQTAFKSLKKMTIDVLSSEDKGPLQNVRQMKISSTAELIPAFKPALHAWEVEAYYFRRTSTPRLPSGSSSTANPKK